MQIDNNVMAQHADIAEEDATPRLSTIIVDNCDDYTSSERGCGISSSGDAATYSVELRDVVEEPFESSSIQNTGKIKKSPNVVVGFNITNLICGVGILGVPYGVMLTGWFSLLLVGLAGLLAHFTGIWLIDCFYSKSGDRERIMDGYVDIGRKVWPRAGHILVYTTMLMELFAVLSLLLLLVSQSTRQMADFFWDVPIEHWQWYIIMTYAAALLVMFRLMIVVAWIGMLASAAVVCTTIILLVFCFLHRGDLELTNMQHIPEPISVSISTSIFLFSFCSHATFPTIEGHMSDPKSYPSLIRMSFTFSSILKMILGSLCVLLFGSATNEQVTYNIPRTQAIHFITACFVGMNAVFTIPLIVFVLTEIVDRILLPHMNVLFAAHGRFHLLWILATRMVMLSCAMLVGMGIPHFSLLMAFIGSVLATSQALIFPALFNVVLNWTELSRFQRGCRIAVGVLGMCIGVFGSIASLLKIVDVMTVKKT